MGLPASSQAGLMVNAHMIDALLMKTDLSATCSPAHILQRSVSREPFVVRVNAPAELTDAQSRTGCA